MPTIEDYSHPGRDAGQGRSPTAALASNGIISPDPLTGASWDPTQPITWSIATTNIPGQISPFSNFFTPDYANLARQGMTAWESVSGANLQEVPDGAGVGIRMGFQALNTPNGGPIGLATWNESGGRFMPGVIAGVEDPAENPTTPTPDGNFNYNGWLSDFFQIINHEQGHALGLDHNQVDDSALMWPISQDTNTAINLNDVLGVQSLYGKNPAGLPPLTITDPGPYTMPVAANGSIQPFQHVTLADGIGLGETVQVTVKGPGAIRDPLAGTNWTFSNGVFTESDVNLLSPGSANEMLHRLTFDMGPIAAETELDIKVTNSLDEVVTDDKNVINAIPPPPVASPDGTIVTTDGPAIIDTHGWAWTIHNGRVAINGQDDAETRRVVALAKVDGKIWQQNADRLWWTKSNPGDTWNPPQGQVLPPIAITLHISDNNTVLANDTQTIIDRGYNTWSIVDGKVDINGQIDQTTGRVTQLAFVDGRVWQENADHLWWSKDGANSDRWLPPDGTPTPPLTGAPQPPQPTIPAVIATDQGPSMQFIEENTPTAAPPADIAGIFAAAGTGIDAPGLSSSFAARDPAIWGDYQPVTFAGLLAPAELHSDMVQIMRN